MAVVSRLVFFWAAGHKPVYVNPAHVATVAPAIPDAAPVARTYIYLVDRDLPLEVEEVIDLVVEQLAPTCGHGEPRGTCAVCEASS